MLPGETIFSGAPEVCPNCDTCALPLRVLQSGAGWYVGTYCNCGPYSRETGYYKTEAEAEKVKEQIHNRDFSELRK